MRTSALDRFRACLGAVLFAHFAYMSRAWTLGWEWLSPAGFHVPAALQPQMPVAPLLPEALVPWFGLLFFGVLAAWALGFHPRWTSPAALALVAYVTWADILTHHAINRIFLVTLLILTLAAWDRAAEWPARILRLYLVTLYFTAGWAKTLGGGDWLTNPDALASQLQIDYMNGLCAWMLRTLPPGFWTAAQWGTVLFELSAPILFFNRRLLPLALVLGVTLHLGIGLLMQDLLTFGLQMLCFYLLFLPGSSAPKTVR